MFDKIRYAYHLTCCERMIKNYSYIERDYELNKKFKWHKRKLNELMVKVHKRSRSSQGLFLYYAKFTSALMEIIK